MTIAQMWEEYWGVIAPRRPDEYERLAARRAFYCGAWSLLRGLGEGIGRDDPGPAGSVDVVEAFAAELDGFMFGQGIEPRPEGKPCDCKPCVCAAAVGLPAVVRTAAAQSVENPRVS